jgi:hypothetical protein
VKISTLMSSATLISFFALTLSACASGTGKLPGDGDGDGDDSDDGGDDGDDTASDDDTAVEEEVPSIEDWGSDWVGSAEIISTGDDNYGWTDCIGTLELDVDPDGEVSGDGVCEGDDGGWGGPDSYSLDFNGTIDAEGVLTGIMVVDAGSWGDIDLTVGGAAEDDALQAEFNGEAIYDGWGDNQYILTLAGTFALERE